MRESDLSNNEDNIRIYLSQLTVIIPTRNRPSDLKRVIKYWGKWPVTIIVLDGSDNPQVAENFEPGAATLVVYADVDFAARITWCAGQLSTPYACLQPDDDFVLCRGAAQAISWLETNSDFVAFASDGQFFTPDYQFMTSAQGRWLRSSDPRTRLLEHFKNFSWSYVYAIHRSWELRATLRAVADSISTSQYLESPHSVAGEFAFEICGSLIGPIACGSDVILLKAVGNQSEYLSWDEQPWQHWLKNENAKGAILSYIAAMSNSLATHLDRPAGEISEWIVDALSSQPSLARSVSFDPCQFADGVRRFPVPLDIVERTSFRIRPTSHTSSDTRVGVMRRWQRRSHRFTFRLVRTTFRVAARIGGRPVGKLPNSDWNWGNPDDMVDFWEAVDENG